MPPMKLDFALEQTDQHQEAAAAAKAGTAVTFAAGDSSSELFAHDQSGARLGLVPRLLQQALLTESFTATVRSCRRQGTKVTELTIRAVASGEQQVPVQLPGPAQDTEGSENQAEILEGTTQLPQSQLELLAASDSIKSLLKDERLQQQILRIDKTADREKALQQAFQNTDFKAFTDQVLEVIATR